MKRVLFALALLGVAVGGANADPAVLEGGALIAHYDPMYIYSDAPCDDYYLYPLTVCDDQVNRIDAPAGSFVEVTWYVIADFDEDKVWCGCQFGFSAYNPDVMYFIDSSPCYPPDGGLEIASPGWPGPDEGTAIVVTGAAWEGDMVPQYAFNAYAYNYGAADIVQLVPDPSVAIPFGGVGNCASPPEKWDAQLGGMGVNMDGVWVCGIEPVYDYVCCVGEACFIVHDEQGCIDLNGEFHPEWDTCEPNPCETYAACCRLGVCTIATSTQCEAIGGEWHPEWPECEPNPCPPFGACCFDQCVCEELFEEECLAQGGMFVGGGEGSCDPNPCPGTPTEITSWGSIKSLYR